MSSTLYKQFKKSDLFASLFTGQMAKKQMISKALGKPSPVIQTIVRKPPVSNTWASTASPFSTYIGTSATASSSNTFTFYTLGSPHPTYVSGPRQDHYAMDDSMLRLQHEHRRLLDEVADGVLLRRRRMAVQSPDRMKWLSRNFDPTDYFDQMSPRFVEGFALESGKGYIFPDGSKLLLDKSGNYAIEDVEAKVIYRANRIREFNPYISASDLLEHFIREVGQIDGVEQTEVLRLPIEAFIHWLILAAAKRDGDSTEHLPTVEAALPKPPPPPPRTLPRCLFCGRFIKSAWARAQLTFCSPEHFERLRIKVELPPVSQLKRLPVDAKLMIEVEGVMTEVSTSVPKDLLQFMEAGV